MPKITIFAAALLALATTAAIAAEPATIGRTAKGRTLIDARGRTLYTFDKDADGRSACNGPCAENWPPLTAKAAAKASADYTLVARDDGGRQWAYKGKPLYTWIKDTKPGDITGDGFLGGAWHVAQP